MDDELLNPLCAADFVQPIESTKAECILAANSRQAHVAWLHMGCGLLAGVHKWLGCTWVELEDR